MVSSASAQIEASTSCHPVRGRIHLIALHSCGRESQNNDQCQRGFERCSRLRQGLQPLYLSGTRTLTFLPHYLQVQGILIGVVAAFVVIVTIIGPE